MEVKKMPQAERINIALVKPVICFIVGVNVEAKVKEIDEEKLNLLLEAIEYSIEICEENLKKDSVRELMELLFPGFKKKTKEIFEEAIRTNKKALFAIRSEIQKSKTERCI